MKIIRAGFDDAEHFSKEELCHGACCFFAQDKSSKYLFKIDGQEATLYADNYQYQDQAIDEFLFYSSYICCIKDPSGRILRQRHKVKTERIKIADIQPSQFYINERKLACCKQWIKSQDDIMIPTAMIDGKIVSLDGHTRLRAALDLGYEIVTAYPDDCGEYITYFQEEAIRRDIRAVTDMAILSDEEYRVKWHKFCDDFFGRL